MSKIKQETATLGQLEQGLRDGRGEFTINKGMFSRIKSLEGQTFITDEGGGRNDNAKKSCLC